MQRERRYIAPQAALMPSTECIENEGIFYTMKQNSNMYRLQ